MFQEAEHAQDAHLGEGRADTEDAGYPAHEGSQGGEGGRTLSVAVVWPQLSKLVGVWPQLSKLVDADTTHTAYMV